MLKNILVAASVVVFLAACGKDHVSDKQSNERESLEAAVAGEWIVKLDKQQTELKIGDGKFTVTRTYFYEVDRKTKHYTSTQTTAYYLVNNYKEGILNSIVFEPADSLTLTLHSDYDVKKQNANLEAAKKLETQPILEAYTPSQAKDVERINAQILAVKEVTNWTRDESKTLTRLAAERLQGQYLGVMGYPTAFDYGSRTSTSYEVDNGYLKAFGLIFSRK